MAVFADVAYHRLEWLGVHIVVVAVDEIDTFVSSQVVKSLLHRQPKLSPELRNEDQRPLYFIGIAVHSIIHLEGKISISCTDKQINQQNSATEHAFLYLLHYLSNTNITNNMK